LSLAAERKVLPPSVHMIVAFIFCNLFLVVWERRKRTIKKGRKHTYTHHFLPSLPPNSETPIVCRDIYIYVSQSSPISGTLHISATTYYTLHLWCKYIISAPCSQRRTEVINCGQEEK
jgi:hypothetical protein